MKRAADQIAPDIPDNPATGTTNEFRTRLLDFSQRVVQRRKEAQDTLILEEFLNKLVEWIIKDADLGEEKMNFELTRTGPVTIAIFSFMCPDGLTIQTFVEKFSELVVPKLIEVGIQDLVYFVIRQDPPTVVRVIVNLVLSTHPPRIGHAGFLLGPYPKDEKPLPSATTFAAFRTIFQRTTEKLRDDDVNKK